jgi:hypothetical protein
VPRLTGWSCLSGRLARAQCVPNAKNPLDDSLLAYRAAGGTEGLTLVPDLATTHSRSNSRTNRRRSAIHLLRAQRHPLFRRRHDRRQRLPRGLERAFIVGGGYSPTDWYYGIVGGRRCHDVPRMCDLTSTRSQPVDQSRRRSSSCDLGLGADVARARAVLTDQSVQSEV